MIKKGSIISPSFSRFLHFFLPEGSIGATCAPLPHWLRPDRNCGIEQLCLNVGRTDWTQLGRELSYRLWAHILISVFSFWRNFKACVNLLLYCRDNRKNIISLFFFNWSSSHPLSSGVQHTCPLLLPCLLQRSYATWAYEVLEVCVRRNSVISVCLYGHPCAEQDPTKSVMTLKKCYQMEVSV